MIQKALREAREFFNRTILSNRCICLLRKGIRSLTDQGFKATWERVRGKFRNTNFLRRHKSHQYTEAELQRQREARFPQNIKFSIVVPLYNTGESFLTQMIRSVQDQTYGNWELCLADGSDEAHGYVRQVCEKLAIEDKRIRYRKLENNLGISGNSNAALAMASGGYIALLDHDDMLSPAALFSCMEAICRQNADFIYSDEIKIRKSPKDAFEPHFKPDFAPDTLRSLNYICHLAVFKASLLEAAGKFRPECDGSQDYDLVLRLTEQAEKIVHIPKLLYFWRCHPDSVAESVEAKPYVIAAAHRAVADHLDRVGLKGCVRDSAVPTAYQIAYDIEEQPLVSILIHHYENPDMLIKCLDSIYEKTTYRNFEVIVVEHSRKIPETGGYFEKMQETWENLRIVPWEHPINHAAMSNYAAEIACGEHLLLLRGDTEVITPDWIQQMLMYSQRNDVGAVGAKLYYADDTIRHAGLGIGIGTAAGRLHRNFHRNHQGYMGRLMYVQNLSGVSADCLMIRRNVWDRMDGLDAGFPEKFFDVDLCLRLRQAGYLIVWTPFAELYHYAPRLPVEKDTREIRLIRERWQLALEAGDPYLNPNFDPNREDFAFRP